MDSSRDILLDIISKLSCNDFSSWTYPGTTQYSDQFITFSSSIPAPTTLIAYISATRSVCLEPPFAPVEGTDSTSTFRLFGDIPDGCPLIIRTKATGSLVSAGIFRNCPLKTVHTINGGKAVTLGPFPDIEIDADKLYLPPPNSFGPPPSLTQGQIIPANSPKVCCAIGQFTRPKDGKVVKVIMDQYWRRSSDSFSLAPSQRKRVLVETTSGITDTTSDSTTIDTSLGLSVSAGASVGWAAVSACLTASLNVSSSAGHTVVLQNENITTSEDIMASGDSRPILVVYWELVDAYSILDENWNLLAVVEHAQSPAVVKFYPEDAKFAIPSNAEPRLESM